MPVNSVNYSNPYAGYVNNQQQKNKNKVGCGHHQCVIFPPREDAHKQAKKNTATALGVIATAILAFAFRGKIKNAIQALKPYVQGALTKVKTVAQKYAPKVTKAITDAAKKVKPYAQKVGTFVTDMAAKVKPAITKGWNAVKAFFTKVKP